MLPAQQLPPTSWVDKDTGHRVWRISSEPNSGGFYFNVNAYTPDHKQMLYTAPGGIHVLDLATKQTRLLVPNPPRPTNPGPTAPRGFGGARTIVVGSKTNSIFYTQMDPATHTNAVYKADTNTGAIRKLADPASPPTKSSSFSPAICSEPATSLAPKSRKQSTPNQKKSSPTPS